MVEELKLKKTHTSLKAIGAADKLSLVAKSLTTANTIKASLKTVNSTAMVFLFGLMEKNMKETT